MFKLKKSKTQKGITLIALIITIVVLLILAAVAIASITNDGVLSYAENATTQYNQAVKNEQDTLQGYIDYLNKHSGSSESGEEGSGESGSETIGKAEVDKITTSNSTINGEEPSENNPIIPEGFKPINTETSKWDDGDLEDDVKNGLVISDEAGNEFVWIPVSDINDMAKVTSGIDANGRTNYEGKLYDFDGTSSTEMEDYGQDTNWYKEPANLTYYYEGEEYIDCIDSASSFRTIIWTETYYQESFNKMVESVAEYKGFYVGRYEMSLDENGNSQSKVGVKSLTAYDVEAWWGLYEKATTYSNSGVISEMIWGCQYDAMMRWMQSNNIDVTFSDDSNLNNVYDIYGYNLEWTQEAKSDAYRNWRGGPGRQESYPVWAEDRVGTRLTLYVEV